MALDIAKRSGDISTKIMHYKKILYISLIFIIFIIGQIADATADEGLGFLAPAPAKNLEDGNLFMQTGSFGREANIIATTKNLSGSNYISLSYEGSTGLLGFSSGYIYPPDNENDLLADVTSAEISGYLYADRTANVYMGLDLAHSIALTEDIVLGLGASVIYLGDIYSEDNDGSLSLLLVMPLEINEHFKIMPRFHWSRSLKYYLDNHNAATMNEVGDKDENDTFFGGVSISFAY